MKTAGQLGKPLSPSEYILRLHAPEHYVAVLLVNRGRGQRPTGPTPRQLQSGLVQIEPTKETRE